MMIQNLFHTINVLRRFVLIYSIDFQTNFNNHTRCMFQYKPHNTSIFCWILLSCFWSFLRPALQLVDSYTFSPPESSLWINEWRFTEVGNRNYISYIENVIYDFQLLLHTIIHHLKKLGWKGGRVLFFWENIHLK